MATYNSVKGLPNSQRVALISSVAVGDQIDIIDVLGRPARKLQFHTTDATDEISYKFNHLLRLKKEAADGGDYFYPGNANTEVAVEKVWSGADRYSEFTSTGLVIESGDGLGISSVELTAATLSTGAVIEIVVW